MESFGGLRPGDRVPRPVATSPKMGIEKPSASYGRTAEQHATLVQALQDEYIADDLDPPDDAISWSESKLRKWFDDGGKLQLPQAPTLPSDLPPAPTSAQRTAQPGVVASAPPRKVAALGKYNAAVAAAAALPYEAHRGREGKYRVLMECSARESADETSKIVCSIDEGSIVTIDEERTSAQGNSRVRLVDPVWNCWLTRREASSGAVFLEPLTAGPPATLGGIKLPPPPPRAISTESGNGDVGHGSSGDNGDSADGGSGGGRKTSAAEEATKPLSDREKRERDSGRWTSGMMVLLTGLRKMREYNGRSGVIAEWQGETGKYLVNLANRQVRVLPNCLDMHPMQRKREQETKGDEVVFLTTDEAAARAGTYGVKLDPQFWFECVAPACARRVRPSVAALPDPWPSG